MRNSPRPKLCFAAIVGGGGLDGACGVSGLSIAGGVSIDDCANTGDGTGRSGVSLAGDLGGGGRTGVSITGGLGGGGLDIGSWILDSPPGKASATLGMISPFNNFSP